MDAGACARARACVCVCVCAREIELFLYKSQLMERKFVCRSRWRGRVCDAEFRDGLFFGALNRFRLIELILIWRFYSAWLVVL